MSTNLTSFEHKQVIHMLTDLPQKIKKGEAVVCVIGLGRVGLPLGIVLALSGLQVVGIDIDKHKVSNIKSGKMPFYYPVMHGWLQKALSKGAFTASSQPKESIEQCDVIIVTVGTPMGIHYQIDYSQLHFAIREVGEADLTNRAVIVRSTAVPGTMVNIVLPMLKRISGLRPGVDFALAACPERILEGQAHTELYELPEIIGAIDDLSGDIAQELFLKINSKKVILRTTPTAAELAKLFSNIYRYVGFALANEFAIWAEKYGENASEIIRTANDGYPRSRIPKPGFAGGPCLGKDGFLLDNNTTFSSIVSAAWKLNEGIPQHIVASLMGELGSLCGIKIAVLGLAFKANSDDVRLSPSAKLVEILRAYGADVLVHDPNIKETLPITEVLQSPDVVILATNHPAFTDVAASIDKSGCKIIYDVWNMFKPNDFTMAKYMGFGRAK